ncbi:MAG: hypothetical protein VB778_00855 [Nitrospinaceae bacterium]
MGNYDIGNTKAELETTLTENLEKDRVQVKTESSASVLGLGKDELFLEVYDSDGPLSTTNIETPEIEIEVLGL